MNITVDGTTEDVESFLVKLEVPLHEPAVVLGLNTSSILIVDGKPGNIPIYIVMYYGICILLKHHKHTFTDAFNNKPGNTLFL